MNKKEAIALLENATYKFAKTAKNRNPHWYTLRKTWEQDEKFLQVAKFIEENGKEEWFWKIRYLCFHHKGWKWWTVPGYPLDLINKTYVSEQYNAIANKYDDIFTSKDYLLENEYVASQIKPFVENNTVLDVGCGTGLLLDYLNLDTTKYLGIDPSYGMIKKAREKHSEYKFLVDKLETYQKKHDVLVSLFCAMNYVLPEYMYKVSELSSSHYLMFYYGDFYKQVYDMYGIKMYCHNWTESKLRKVFPTSRIQQYRSYIVVDNLRQSVK